MAKNEVLSSIRQPCKCSSAGMFLKLEQMDFCKAPPLRSPLTLAHDITTYGRRDWSVIIEEGWLAEWWDWGRLRATRRHVFHGKNTWSRMRNCIRGCLDACRFARCNSGAFKVCELCQYFFFLTLLKRIYFHLIQQQKKKNSSLAMQIMPECQHRNKIKHFGDFNFRRNWLHRPV